MLLEWDYGVTNCRPAAGERKRNSTRFGYGNFYTYVAVLSYTFNLFSWLYQCKVFSPIMSISEFLFNQELVLMYVY